MCWCNYQEDALCLDDYSPGPRVQDERLHKVVLRNVNKSGLPAGSKDDLLGLFRAWKIHKDICC